MTSWQTVELQHIQGQDEAWLTTRRLKKALKNKVLGRGLLALF